MRRRDNSDFPRISRSDPLAAENPHLVRGFKDSGGSRLSRWGQAQAAPKSSKPWAKKAAAVARAGWYGPPEPSPWQKKQDPDAEPSRAARIAGGAKRVVWSGPQQAPWLNQSQRPSWFSRDWRDPR